MARNHRQDEPVSEAEFDQLSDRITEHFDRVRDRLTEAMSDEESQQ